MSKLAQIRRIKPNGTLYHYSTSSGLLGIFRTKKLWTTSIHYLNDAKEFIHTIHLVQQKLRDLLDSNKTLVSNMAFNRVLNRSELLKLPADIFVCFPKKVIY